MPFYPIGPIQKHKLPQTTERERERERERSYYSFYCGCNFDAIMPSCLVRAISSFNAPPKRSGARQRAGKGATPWSLTLARQRERERDLSLSLSLYISLYLSLSLFLSLSLYIYIYICIEPSPIIVRTHQNSKEPLEILCKIVVNPRSMLKFAPGKSSQPYPVADSKRCHCKV